MPTYISPAAGEFAVSKEQTRSQPSIDSTSTIATSASEPVIKFCDNAAPPTSSEPASAAPDKVCVVLSVLVYAPMPISRSLVAVTTGQITRHRLRQTRILPAGIRMSEMSPAAADVNPAAVKVSLANDI